MLKYVQAADAGTYGLEYDCYDSYIPIYKHSFTN